MRATEADGDSAGPSTRRPVDEIALRRVLARLACADKVPWLHGEVARRMAERLPVILRQPGTVIDWGSQSGASRETLRRAYPKARLSAVESTVGQRESSQRALAAPWWSPRRWSGFASEALLESAVPDARAELLWANMVLHGRADPLAMMMQWQRALAVDGFLMFSTLGPDTLRELRALYAAQGWPVPMAPLVDMHDLGDMLVRAGFADPVMDQERITLTWPTASALLEELRGLGGNISPLRHVGLRTPRWQRRLEGLLEKLADTGGRPALTFEIVYGHAFKAAPRPGIAGQTTVGLDEMRKMVRSRRPTT